MSNSNKTTEMYNKSGGKEQIQSLINKYQDIVNKEKLNQYNEEITKKDFILPMFHALGWDEVFAEEKVSRGRVGYALKINGIPKLFVGAKALKVDLDKEEFAKDKEEFAKQAINYAWHKGATWVVLTNFKEIKVYNAKWKGTNPTQNLFFSIELDQYVGESDKIWILSRDSMKKGLLDKKAEKRKNKAKKIPVDKQLLKNLAQFRGELSKSIAMHNQGKQLLEEDVDEVVQHILDKLMFIRLLEDRQIYPFMLQEISCEDKKKAVHIRLGELFKKIDKIYNSKLFRKHLYDNLIIDSHTLEMVICGLYSSSDGTIYDFSLIDADILGNMYEQHLGNILKKTDKKKTHRKEQGVYYTPTYIIDYIVKNTIGELINQKKFDIDKIKILDPACGSGSFLMKAYDHLLTLHNEKKETAEQTKLDITTDMELPYEKKVDILKNSIFGVDLDPKAVEIAQLNLLLKVAEKKHQLPILQDNIRLGNSLVDDPNYEDSRAFKWEKEFKDIFSTGGFDVIISNPPWGADIDNITEYLKENERSLGLLKENGLLGFIVPSTILFQSTYKDIRQLIKEYSITHIINLGEKVFKEVETPSCIIIIRKQINKKNKVKIMDVSYSKDNFYKKNKLLSPQYTFFPQKIYENTIDNIFVTFYRELKKDEMFLGDVLLCKDTGINYSCKGMGMKNKGKSDLSKRIIYSGKHLDKNDHEFLKGADINRYVVNYHPGRYLRKNYNSLLKENEFVGYDIITFNACPKILWRQTADRPIAAIDYQGVWYGRSIHAGILKDKRFDLKYIAALLNSNYLAYIYSQISKEKGRIFAQVKLNKIKKMPIKIAGPKEQEILSANVEIIEKYKAELLLYQSYSSDEKKILENKIRDIETNINEYVYRLYEVPENEKSMIEEIYGN